MASHVSANSCKLITGRDASAPRRVLGGTAYKSLLSKQVKAIMANWWQEVCDPFSSWYLPSPSHASPLKGSLTEPQHLISLLNLLRWSTRCKCQIQQVSKPPNTAKPQYANTKYCNCLKQRHCQIHYTLFTAPDTMVMSTVQPNKFSRLLNFWGDAPSL